jgi:hypothetical protein
MANEDLVGGDLVEVSEKLSDRHELFCKTYVSNGRNATKAYIAVGYSPDGATVSASKLLAKPNVTKRIKELSAPIFEKAQLSLEKILEQVAAVAMFDQRKLFYPDGSPIPLHLLDDATSFAISHIGKEGPVPFSKMAGIDIAMKYLGAFEKDNSQRAPNLALNIVLE